MSFCVHCTTGFSLPGTPKGTIERLGPYDTYIASPPSGADVDEDRAIYYAYDAFGLSEDMPNNKLIPDILAEKLGMRVYVPDVFEGQGISPATMSMPSTASEARSASFFTKVSNNLRMLKIVPWFISHRPGTKLANLQEWFSAVEEAKGVQSWGATSYCYGAKPSLHFNAQGKLKAHVLCHPSFVAADDIKAVKAPCMFLCADEDPIFTEALKSEAEKILKERQDVKFEFHSYPK